jgi:hypothetical protein
MDYDIEGNPITYDIEGNPSSDAYTSFGSLDYPSSGDTSLMGVLGWNPDIQPTDPTNTGDTGAFQNTSSAYTPSKNNPETGGSSSLGTVLSSAFNAAFAGWQLASQPQGTPRTISTQVGNTKVLSGAPASGSFAGAFGATTQQQQSTLLLVVVAIAVVAWFYSRRG